MDCIGALMDETCMRINERGISCIGMDPSHVAMVEFNLPPSAFDRFDPFDEMIVWNLEWLKKRVFKGATKGEYLKFRNLADGKNKQEWIRMERGLKRIKRMVNKEPFEEEVPKPKVMLKGHVRILTKTLHKALNDFDEHVKMKLDNDIFSLSYTDTDDNEQETPWTKDSDVILEMKQQDSSSIESTYTVSYLIDMLNVAKRVSEVVKISISNDMPVKIDVELPQGILLFWLAPCIGV